MLSYSNCHLPLLEDCRDVHKTEFSYVKNGILCGVQKIMWSLSNLRPDKRKATHLKSGELYNAASK